MFDEIKLRPYQWAMAEHIINNKRCALWCSMGSGKTVSTLIAIDNLSLLEPVFPVLIIAPLRVAKTTWPDEVKKWTVTSHLTMSVVCGSLKDRLKGLAQHADIYTINLESIPWLVAHYGNDWPFKMVVVDESTRLKSWRPRQGSMRARELGRVAHKHVGRFVELTGTPAPQGLTDLFGQAWFLDQGFRLGTSYRAFTDRWFRSQQVGKDPHATKLIPSMNAQREIETALKDICLTIDATDYMEVLEAVPNVITVTLPKAARATYDEMETEMFTRLDDEDIEAFSAAAVTMKCLQIANGAIYVPPENKSFIEVHDAKLEALESIIQEAAGQPILVSYKFQHDLARLQEYFPHGRSLDSDPQTIADWNAGLIPLLFAHPQSAGHGLNLAQGGNILVFFSIDWNLEHHMQIIERVGPIRQAQLGQGKTCFIHYILAANTVDQLVMERLRDKKSVQDVLLNAMKSRKGVPA